MGIAFVGDVQEVLAAALSQLACGEDAEDVLTIGQKLRNLDWDSWGQPKIRSAYCPGQI